MSAEAKPEAEAKQEAGKKQPVFIVEQIALVRLRVAEENCRKVLRADEDETTIEHLADDIERHGLLHPLTVRPNAKDGYDIIAGQRRFLALRHLGRETAPCHVIHVSAESAEEVSLVENVQRNPMTNADKVRTYSRLYDLCGRDIKKLSKIVSISAPTLQKYIKLAELPPAVLDKLDAKSGEGRLTLDTAVHLTALKNDPRIAQAADALAQLGTNEARRDAIAKLTADPKMAPAVAVERVAVDALQNIVVPPGTPFVPDDDGRPLIIPRELYADVRALVRQRLQAV